MLASCFGSQMCFSTSSYPNPGTAQRHQFQPFPKGQMVFHGYPPQLHTPGLEIQLLQGQERAQGTHLNFNIPAVDDFHNAHHVIKHQTQLLAVVCKEKQIRAQRFWRLQLLHTHTSRQEQLSGLSPLTQGDGVDLAFDLECTVCALENICYLLQFCVTDHQVSGILLVFLKKQRKHISFSECRAINP